MAKYNFEPPEERYVVLDCGCEVYDGEYSFEFVGKTYCYDCLLEKLRKMPPELLIDYLGGEMTKIEFRE